MENGDREVQKFYLSVLNMLVKNKIPFMIGGGYSVKQHSYIDRPMKDLDIFCKPGDIPKTLGLLKEAGFKVSVPDERWLAKVIKNKQNVDLIFSSPNYINPVDDSWFKNSKEVKLFGIKVRMVGPEEIIWTKSFVQDRTWYEGADINHVILNQGKNINWKRGLSRMDNYWEVLLGILIDYRFVYPSERGLVPKWLMEELISRLQNQLKNPIPKDKICRGPLLSRSQYTVDIERQGFEFFR